MKAVATVVFLAVLMNVGSACGDMPSFKGTFDLHLDRIWPLAYDHSPFVHVPATGGAVIGGVAGAAVGVPAGLLVAGPEFLVRAALGDFDNDYLGGLAVACHVFTVPVAVGSVGAHYLLGGPPYLIKEGWNWLRARF
ncbi:MAG: hypothetical protein FJ290_19795 [Planctomycetes bacterium]|nr:hypothetical protein [Planctomycetota bacterium]